MTSQIEQKKLSGNAFKIALKIHELIFSFKELFFFKYSYMSLDINVSNDATIYLGINQGVEMNFPGSFVHKQ
ncbi:CLUMA_CG015540, isoform A [Clunio marinus]|uniref:CLUMA_CG015540, isoform A n=1 Tax=Clunio marinus TaxID=568069 RepID=A0A1J1IP05_9DIPT|nr:CLUMA_CG015540, isoform A [Clunio marinus]